MQLTKLLVLLSLSSTSTVLACKCLNNGGGKNNAATESCCKSTNGVFQYGEDCNAGSISEHLSGFRSCCNQKGAAGSDCDYRIAENGKEVAEGDVKVEQVATRIY